MKSTLLQLITLCFSFTVWSTDYHVAKNGNDQNKGTIEAPFLTIQKAATLAQAGDVIIVHKGVYREQITPFRGGESDSKRINYQAAEGEKVEIKGSEVIQNWKKFKGTVWKTTIPNSFFQSYNPYKVQVKGDWFDSKGRIHHTGEVYLNGKSLWEMAMLEKVLNPQPVKDNFDPEGSIYAWYCEVDKENTYIYANFHEFDPTKELVEINVRKSCFYPDENNIDYITIRGFHMSQAATQWAPPTAEQIGLIGTNWSRGWIIENNIIRNSKCSGITLGKYGDEFDNTSENLAGGYVETIRRALARDWSKENIGSHIIRNNVISDCEQAGICGSMGAVFSTIENNDIYNIWTKRMWDGAEMGGIKIHASIDMLIKNNRLVNCDRGLWLDWMCQGTRVTGNLLYKNTSEDIYVEVNHGPFLVDNNILLSPLSIRDWSQGGAYVHNLIVGNIQLRPQNRETPFQFPHATGIAGLKTTKCGDNRFFNNIFVGGTKETKKVKTGLGAYLKAELPMYVEGNVYLNDATAFKNETNRLILKYDPNVQFEENETTLTLKLLWHKQISKMKNRIISSKALGKAQVSGVKFENPDGSEFRIESDFLGQRRSSENPTPGPFENPKEGEVAFIVWKK